MLDRNSKKSTESSLRGKGQIWVAVACIGLSNILGALWIWSLIWPHPMR